jgi:hypothetical protein
MAKILLFAEPLPELVLKGIKTSTWRVDDKRNTPFIKLKLIEGDELSLCRNDGSEFAKAIVVSIEKTTFGQLNKEEMEGHEKFASDEEMYKTYSGYYKFLNIPIDSKTKLKIIRFKLLK